jgi:hypothetical protein
MNLGGHRRNEVKDYADGDPVLASRLAAGWVVPVDEPVAEVAAVAAPAKKRNSRRRTEDEVQAPSHEAVEEPVAAVEVVEAATGTDDESDASTGL